MMKKKLPSTGLRIIKSAVAVALCFFLYPFYGDRVAFCRHCQGGDGADPAGADEMLRQCYCGGYASDLL